MAKKKLSSQPVEPAEDIAKELGVRTTPAGEQYVDSEVVKKEGAVNVTGSQDQRRRAKIIDRKRQGERKVHWNEVNACLFYDDLVSIWPAQSLMIFVQRMSGQPTSWYLMTSPRTGKELYESVKSQCHGRHEEAEYQVQIRDAQTKYTRGAGRMYLPNTMDEGVHPPPPQYAPYAMPYAPQLPPGFAPVSADPMVAQLQRELAETRAVLARLVPQAAAPAPGPQPAQPQPQTAAQSTQAMPTQYPGVYYVPGMGLVQGVPTGPQQQPTQPVASPAANDPQAALRSSFDLARSSITMAADLGTAARSLVPTPVVAPVVEPAEEATKLVDLGAFKVMQNTTDGSLRPVETVLANSDKIMSWIEKQQEKYQTHQKWMVQQQQRMQQQQNGGAQPQPQNGQQQQPQQSTGAGFTMAAPSLSH